MKREEALREYQEKIKAGELERTIPLDPTQKAKANPKSLRLAINAKCYDCVCFSRIEVTRCDIKNCPLWNVRPWQKKEDEDE